MTCGRKDNIHKIVRIAKRKKDKVIIVLDNKKPFGVITLSDIVFKAVASGRNMRKIKAEEIASKDIYYLDEKEDECKAYMYMLTRNHLFCSITRNEKFIGLLNLSDLIKKSVADHCSRIKRKK
jgi:signal-transduction protein with cAMP-binding, CBS, and nucleotidyltransferase domain